MRPKLRHQIGSTDALAKRSRLGWACAAALVLAFAALPDPAAAACPNEEIRSVTSVNLPNCRAYEKVSPADKGGNYAVRLEYPTRAAADGNTLSFLEQPYANASSGWLFNAYVGRRGPEGWTVTNVSPPGTPDPLPGGGAFASYYFSSDFSEHVVEVAKQAITEDANPMWDNAFHRDASGSYSLINTKPQVPCPEPSLEQACFQLANLIAFGGSSADFRHLLFQTRASFFDFEDREQLFRADLINGRWEMSPVGILPDGEPTREGSAPGSGMFVWASNVGTGAVNRVTNAISADGSRVFFQAQSNEGEPNEAGQLGINQVYARLNGNETIAISTPAPGAAPAHPGAAPAQFWAASAAGDRVFFTSPAELTTESNTGPSHEGNDLYEYNFNRAGQELVDLTAHAGDPAGARVLGVLDAAEDGSYVYFVARARLDGSKGEEGQPNLYVVNDAGAPTFIATLAEDDLENWTQAAALRESYVTPSGETVAFTSQESIPSVGFPGGPNNVNPRTGRSERAIYVYSARSDDLFCASCNPTGSAPEAPSLLGGVIAPGDGPFDPPNTQSDAFHQVRAVSDDGSRVFFDTRDALTASVEPENTKRKVYQWERPGASDCAIPVGCIDLISGRTAATNSTFIEASADGSNVFFATGDQLLPTDEDVLLDIYNARVDGGFPVNLPPAPCSGEQCRPSIQPPPASGSPATSVFEGRGNPIPEGRYRCRRGKVRRKGRCVRRHQHKNRHHRRGGDQSKNAGDRR